MSHRTLVRTGNRCTTLYFSQTIFTKLEKMHFGMVTLVVVHFGGLASCILPNEYFIFCTIFIIFHFPYSPLFQLKGGEM